MQAVILAGGLGTRLYPLTKTVPKPMVPVNGTPYLEYQLIRLRDQQITNILLLTGYLGEQIESYFGDGTNFGLSIKYSREQQPLGTGGAIRAAMNSLEDSFLVIYGDSYLPISYPDVLKSLDSSDAKAVVTVYDNASEDTGVTNNIAIDHRSTVLKYIKNDPDNRDLKYVEAGVLGLTKCAIEEIPTGKVSLEQEMFPKWIAERMLLGFVTRQRFYDIGTPERLERIAHLFQRTEDAT